MSRNTFRETAHQIAEAAVEGINTASNLAAGAVGAYAAYHLLPATWNSDPRLLAAGSAAIVTAVTWDSLSQIVLMPLRRRLLRRREMVLVAQRRHGQRPTATMSSEPTTVGEALAHAVAATETDAAARAAFDAHTLDRSDGFLGNQARWRGYENGEATLYLAPGLVLHYRSTPTEYGGSAKEFTLLTSDGDQPVRITTVAQLRHHLAARDAGLPVTQHTSPASASPVAA